MKRYLSIAIVALAAMLLLAADTQATENTIPGDAVAALQWTPLATDVTATIYHATASECNADCLHTASMLAIDTTRVSSLRIAAVERTMMDRHGLSYGDVIRVEGAGDLNGLWQVQDLMNSRYAGTNRIDLLVPRSRRNGKWTNVTVSVPSNRKSEARARRMLASL